MIKLKYDIQWSIPGECVRCGNNTVSKTHEIFGKFLLNEFTITSEIISIPGECELVSRILLRIDTGRFKNSNVYTVFEIFETVEEAKKYAESWCVNQISKWIEIIESNPTVDLNYFRQTPTGE